MDMVTLGRTGITVNRNGFGALPVQRVEKQEAARLLRRIRRRPASDLRRQLWSK